MKQTAYGKPLLLNQQESVIPLNQVEAMDEATLQQLVFNHPECLPISDIDEAYNPVISVCMELNTPVGPLDILMVSPNGGITIVETKLWRNPEARRKVVAQILDYAQELSRWSYEDLQREINRRLGTKGNTLYTLLSDKAPHDLLPESDFVDSVSRNLAQGRLLLLIAGDGMREGVQNIAEFLNQATHLNFTMAMVELSLYQAPDLGTLIVPKTLAKTTEIPKIKVDLPPGFTLAQTGQPSTIAPLQSSEKKDQERAFYVQFWQEFVSELTFDDPGQPLPQPANAQNLYVYPADTKKAWISAYFAQSQKRVGVYFRVAGEPEGQKIWEALCEDQQAIEHELGEEVLFNWQPGGDISVRMPCDDIFDPIQHAEIKAFFVTWVNHFVNVIRPRLRRIIN